MGDSVIVDKVYKSCVIVIEDQELLVDLIVLDIFDVILRMNWLSTYAKLDCFQKMVTFPISKSHSIKFVGTKKQTSPHIISAIRANRLLSQGCQGFLAYGTGSLEVKKELTKIPVVCDYQDVFPEDIPGLPPDPKVEISIDIVLGTAPASKAPYKQAPVGLMELKEQVQELLDKGFIRPSTSLLGAPVLFVKKKDGSLRLCIDYR